MNQGRNIQRKKVVQMRISMVMRLISVRSLRLSWNSLMRIRQIIVKRWLGYCLMKNVGKTLRGLHTIGLAYEPLWKKVTPVLPEESTSTKVSKYIQDLANNLGADEVGSFDSIRVGQKVEDTWQFNVENFLERSFSVEDVQKVKFGPVLELAVCGPKKNVGKSDGPLSFDGACTVIMDSKSKSSKTKLVEELGKNVKIVPSFYDCLAPRVFRIGGRAGSFKNTTIDSEDISSSSSHLGNYMTESEVIRCNRRIMRKDSEVGSKLWEYISKLGVVSRA